MQIKPANTAIPVDTPKSVGRSAAMTDKSENFRERKLVHCLMLFVGDNKGGGNHNNQ